jgi:hypothetical protein
MEGSCGQRRSRKNTLILVALEKIKEGVSFRRYRGSSSKRLGAGGSLQLAPDVEMATAAPWPERRRERARGAVVH